MRFTPLLAAAILQVSAGVAAQEASPAATVAEWISRSFVVPETVPVLPAPSAAATPSARLRKGAQVEVIGLLTDPEWLQIRLPDRSLGYVRSAGIPAAAQNVPSTPDPLSAASAEPVPPPAVPASSPPATLGPSLVEGPATTHDTATLLVLESAGPRPVKLLGLGGFGGEPARGMEAFLEGNGYWVRCEPAGPKGHVCKLRDGTDVAKAALVNGAARATPDAPADYLLQEDDARKARRGIWRDGPESVAALPPAAQQPDAAAEPGAVVPGVSYAGEAGTPAEFTADGGSDGLTFVEEQPFTLVEGIPTPLAYVPAIGWGFWDRSFIWRHAPGIWASRLERFHPRGVGLREVNLERRGFSLRESYFRGPAVNASFLPGRAPVALGHTPYPPAAFVSRTGFAGPSTGGLARFGVQGGLPPRGPSPAGSTPDLRYRTPQLSSLPPRNFERPVFPQAAGLAARPPVSFPGRNPGAAYAAPNPANAFRVQPAQTMTPAAQFAAQQAQRGSMGAAPAFANRQASPAASFANRQAIAQQASPGFARAAMPQPHMVAAAPRPAPAQASSSGSSGRRH